MPRIENMIDQLGEASFITTIDLTRGYWQVPVAEADRVKTAFITPFGLYQFKRMPFGLQGAPVTFQRLMDRLVHCLTDFLAAYIDDRDLVIFSTSWKDHLQHLRQVLHRLKDAGLTAKPKKCQLAMKTCSYLGHCWQNSLFLRPRQMFGPFWALPGIIGSSYPIMLLLHFLLLT